jgi:hypothetical protein
VLVVLVVVLIGVEVRGDIRPPPRTVRQALRKAPELADVRPTAAFGALADQLVLDTGLAGSAGTLTSFTTAAGIDATSDGLGPLLLTRGSTLGKAGAWNVNLVGQHYTLDRYDGESRLGAGAPPMLARDTLGNLVGLRMHYDLALHVYGVALALNYALRDDLDASVAVPASHVKLDLHADAQVVRVARGNRFVRVRGLPVVAGDTSIETAGIGDVTLRLKWKLPIGGIASFLPFGKRGSDTYTLNLTSIFPTGAVEQGLGNGSYIVSLGTAALIPWSIRGVRGEVTANAAVAFDITDSTQTRLLYGIGTSAILLKRPFLLVGVVEFLGRSQLDPTRAFGDTGVIVFQGGGVGIAPALGLDVGRKDYFDLSFGLRVPLSKHVLAFVTAIAALNEAGLRPSGVTPTVGIGGNW